MRARAFAFTLGISSLLTVDGAFAQRLGQASDNTDVAWWRVIGALVLCLLLAAGAAFALRYRLRGSVRLPSAQGRRLRLVESLRLSHNVDVCLLECDSEHFLVAATPQGAVLLSGHSIGRDPTAPNS